MLFTTMQSKADAGKGFSGVMPFISGSDRLGFFNQNNGRIYIYDAHFSQCLYIGQISELGAPIQSISAYTSTSGTPNP